VLLNLPVRARLIALLVAAVLFNTLLLVAIQGRQRHVAELMFRDRVTVTERTFGRVVDMKEQTLDLHARDYSIWDEFVRYIDHRDSVWAEVNLRQNASTFPMDVSWTLDRDLKPVFAARFVPGPLLAAPPVPVEDLRRVLAARWFQHFFVRTPEGPLELWVAPVQPGADAQRVTRPHGFYVIGRWWGPRVLADLSIASDGEVVMVEPGRGGRREELPRGTILVDRSLAGLDGRPVAVARLRQPFPVVTGIERDSREILLLMGLAQLALLLIAGISISRWVARPLERIRAALRSERSADLGPLLRRPDEFGRIAELVATAFEQREELETEVAERRRVQQEIVRQKDFIRQTIDTIPDALLVVDKRDRIVLINERALRLFAPGRAGAVGEDVRELLGPLGCSPAFERLRTQSLLVGSPVVEEHDLQLPDAGPRRFRTTHVPLWLPDGEPLILGISEDITERAREEQELRTARDAAEAGTQAKSRFIANVSHELRTPMHGILSLANFGLREAKTEPREVLRDYFQGIADDGEGLLALLNDILDLGRLEAGKMVFDLAPVDLPELLETIVAEFEPLAGRSGLRLELLPIPAGCPGVRADQARIREVLRKLLINSHKFTPGGRVVDLGLEWDEAHVRVRVRDEGVGIPEEELESVFDNFVQSSRTSVAGGTGLGLAICREIVRAHDGRIWAEGRATGGTVLTLELPRWTGTVRDDERRAA
jgi:PAS domain S-box-containing protein